VTSTTTTTTRPRRTRDARDAGARKLYAAEVVRTWRHLRTPRDRALLGVLTLAGLRVSEAVALDVGDVYLDDGAPIDAIRIRSSRAKTRSSRDVPVNRDLTEVLVWYRPSLDDDDLAAPLFTSRQVKAAGDRRLTVRQARRALVGGMRRAGLRRASPHSLRKTFADLANDAGVPLNVIQSLLGHRQLRSTQSYLQVDERQRVEGAGRIRLPFLSLLGPTADDGLA